MKISYKSNENHFRIKNNRVINVYYLNQVRELNILKQRDISLNIILLCSSMLSSTIAIFINEIFEPVRIVSFLSAALFFIFSLTHRAYDYMLILELDNNRRIKLKIDSIELEDVQQVVYKINRVLSMDDYNYPITSNEMNEAAAAR